MEPKVSKRLIAIAGLVPKDSVVCDIGCDHALLPIYLVKNKIAKSAIAMDVVSGPLERAKKNIKKYGLEEKIDTRLSDGFDSLSASEANCIVIAGMGGNLMLELLKRGEVVWKNADTLVLSPHRDEVLIREYMAECCLYDTDVFVEDKKEYYTVMRFKPKERPKALSERQKFFGLNPSGDYILHKKAVYKSILDSLENARPTEDIFEKKKDTIYKSKLLEEKNESI